MTNKKNNLTKGVWLILLCCGIIFFSPNCSRALDLTNVELQHSGSAYVTISGLSINPMYVSTEYYLKATELGDDWIDVFCVEDAWWDTDEDYELVSFTDLENAAKVIREYYYGAGAGGAWSKEVVQIAVWELVFDSVPDLSNGNFRYISGADDENLLKEILGIEDNDDMLGDYFTYTAIGPLSLALSPPGSSSTESSQNYAVPTSVPDADIMWLLGPAFIVLGILGRKKSKEYL